MIKGASKEDKVQILKPLFLILALVFFSVSGPIFQAPAATASPSFLKDAFFSFSSPSFSPDWRPAEVLANLSKKN